MTPVDHPRQPSSSPLVTVVTPSFNASRYIRETIESVRAQDYAPIEHIVVDGGSTDGTVDILKEYPDVRWVSERDRGQAHALNKAFGLARGEILGWLNADDTYELRGLSRAVGFLLGHPELDIVYGDVCVTDGDGRRVGLASAEPYGVGRLLVRNVVPQPGAFLRRRCVHALGGVDEALDYVMDWDLWLRAALSGFKAHYLQGEVLATFRLCPGTKSHEASPEFAREALTVLERVLSSPSLQHLSRRAKHRCLRKQRAALWLSMMLKAIERRDRIAMVHFLVLAISCDVRLAVNRGTWFFLGRGFLGRGVDRLRKYKRRPAPSSWLG